MPKSQTLGREEAVGRRGRRNLGLSLLQGLREASKVSQVLSFLLKIFIY